MTSDPIPTVDLYQPDADQAIDAACRSKGFFYLTGHDVPEQVITGAFEAAERFFALSAEEKSAYHIELAHPHQRGYVPLFGEALDEATPPDFKESFDLGVDLPPDHPDVVAGKPFSAPNVWPDVSGFKNAISTYHDAMMRLSEKLVMLTARGLGLGADFFDGAMHHPVGNLRLLHYPASPASPASYESDATEGCGAHTDYGFMTILAQDDVGGLQVQDINDDWIDITPHPGEFVVNLGDLLTRWTGGRYQARRHRVTGGLGRDRYSIPFFLDPNVDADISVVPTCADETRAALFPPVNAGDYLQSRFDATFVYRQ